MSWGSVRSGRHGGGVTSRVPLPETSQPTARRASTTRSSLMSRPETRAARSPATVMTGIGGGVPTTVTPGSTRPPPYVVSSSTTRSAAASQIVGSTPRSLRLPASEVMRCRRPVRNIDVASQWAASTRMLVVVSDISVVRPPMTPPRPMMPESSVTTRSSADRVRAVPSRVVSRSPSRARRTTIGPCSRSAS